MFQLRAVRDGARGKDARDGGTVTRRDELFGGCAIDGTCDNFGQSVLA